MHLELQVPQGPNYCINMGMMGCQREVEKQEARPCVKAKGMPGYQKEVESQ